MRTTENTVCGLIVLKSGDEMLELASDELSALMLVDKLGVAWIPLSATNKMAITTTAAQAMINKIFLRCTQR